MIRIHRCLLIVGCTIALAVPAQADLTVCNKTAGRVRVAVGYVHPQGDFQTEGWWTLGPCGDCKYVVDEDDTSDPHNYWVFAREVDGSGTWEGNSTLCTGRSPFKIRGRNCEARGLTTRQFMHVQSSAPSHTTNLTGGTSGRVCFD